uniref:Uncharacterized protein n=1 Tax=Anguilla anguilla TaxID=7936 RepID=A0A0E9W1X7_ANGAN
MNVSSALCNSIIKTLPTKRIKAIHKS